MGLKIHKFDDSNDSDWIWSIWSTTYYIFTQTQNTCNLHAFEAEISFMPFSRLYTASRVAVILSGGCEQIIIIISASEARTFRPSWSRRRTWRPPVGPSVRPIRRFVHRLIGSRSRPLHVRSFVRSCMSVHLGSFVRSSAVHSLFFLWPGFNEV